MVLPHHHLGRREASAVTTNPRVLWGGSCAQRLTAELENRPGDTRDWLRARGQLLKLDDDSCAVLLEVAGVPCFIKWYRRRNSWHGALLKTRLGRPARSQDAARKLLRANVRVPEPRGALALPDGVLTLTDGIAEGEDLQRKWDRVDQAAERPLWLSVAAQSLARLHLAGYSHGDCKWSNLLINGDQLYLVDLDAVRKTAPGSRRQARDLARFTLNAEEMALERDQYDQFLERYFSMLSLPRDPFTARMLPELRKLRERHRGRYGERGRELC